MLLPSTEIWSPGGEEVMVVLPMVEKFAVTLLGAFITTETGFAAPEALPDQPENWTPEPGDAVNCTVVPLAKYPSAEDGVTPTDPDPAGETPVVSKY